MLVHDRCCCWPLMPSYQQGASIYLLVCFFSALYSRSIYMHTATSSPYVQAGTVIQWVYVLLHQSLNYTILSSSTIHPSQLYNTINYYLYIYMQCNVCIHIPVINSFALLLHCELLLLGVSSTNTFPVTPPTLIMYVHTYLSTIIYGTEGQNSDSW